jgi:peptidoglycan/xylan/chitin deacetylase (PgdA/CDA1 family)
MLAIQSSGHELGGHSRTHPALTTLSSADAELEIEGSRNEIIAMGGLNVESFAYPFGDYNASVQTMTADAGYLSGRSVERGYNTKVTDKFALKIQQVGRTTTIADIQNWTQQAIADKTWLILMFHQIDDDTSATLGITPQFLSDIVTYVNTTSIDVVTVKEGLSLMNP